MKRFFNVVYEVLEEIGRARAAQRINQSRWDY
jgi:hypothetical protein